MKISIVRPNLYESIFVIWLFLEILLNTTISESLNIDATILNNIENYGIFLLILLQIFVQVRFDPGELVIAVVVGVVFGISGLISHSFMLLSAWIFILGSKESSVDNIIEIAYRVLLFSVPVVILLCGVGILDDMIMIRGDIIRHSLGFSHPNQLGIIVFQLMSCMIYVHRRNINFVHYFILFCSALFLYIVPNSQTNVICIFVLMLLTALFQHYDNINSKFFSFIKNLMIVWAVGSNIYSIIFTIVGIDIRKHPLLYALDDILSYRIRLSHRVYETYGISIMGRYINFEEYSIMMGGAQHLDNAYASLIIRNGLICYLIFSIFYIFLLFYFKERDNMLFLMLFIYSFEGLMTASFISPVRNVFILSFCLIMYRKTMGELENNCYISGL